MANRRKFDYEKRKAIIIKEALKGRTVKDITKACKEQGVICSPSTVYQVMNKDEVQKIIKRAYYRMASSVPKAVDNIVKAADAFDVKQESEDKKISWEANKLIAQSHGLLPTSTQSVVHQTYIQHQTNTVIPPVIAELAAKHFGGMINITPNTPNEVRDEGRKEAPPQIAGAGYDNG